MTSPFLTIFCSRLVRTSAMALVAMAAAQPALSANVSHSGNFSRDDGVQMFTLTLTGPGAVTVTSIGYAGGTNSYGNLVAAGGFDSVLYLFSNLGALLYQSDDGVDVPVDPATGEALDAAFTTASLAAGLYTVALTQADNYMLGFNLADGFAQAGQINFTNAFGCNNGSFCDFMGNNRSSAWALNFSGDTLASVSVVPEPGSLALVLAAGGALVALRRPRRDGSSSLHRTELAAG